MMANNATKDQGEGKTGRESPVGKTTILSADTSRILRMLAKLSGVLAGTLIGLLVTYFISQQFIPPLETLASKAQEIVDAAQSELGEVEPALNKARKEWVPLEGEWERLSISRAQSTAGSGEEKAAEETSDATALDSTDPASTDTSPTDTGLDSSTEVEPEEIVSVAGVTYTYEELSDLRQEYLRLSRKRQKANDVIEQWEAEKLEYQRSIDRVNLLGVAVVIVFSFLGYLLYPLFFRLLVANAGQWDWLFTGSSHRTTQVVVGFVAGMVIGVFILLGAYNVFNIESGILALAWFRLLLGAFLMITLGICGSLMAVVYFSPSGTRPDPYRSYRAPAEPKLLDTSVIIDGRIPEVAIAGFLDGVMVITNSVLRELQTMADSSNDRKRSKGRRGLELLRKMQDDPRLDILVFDDSEFDSQAQGTDEQLIIVAQTMRADVVTNDFNLNRVAAIRDVRVINLNALANAVKTNHIPGDYLEIEVLDRGKQKGQGVGYLEDGTMVVVEDGEPYVGRTETIKLTSVTQTAHGRMLFGRVDAAQGGEH